MMSAMVTQARYEIEPLSDGRIRQRRRLKHDRGAALFVS